MSGGFQADVRSGTAGRNSGPSHPRRASALFERGSIRL